MTLQMTMLNSINLTTNSHYPMKIKSVFDLAVVSSQRYSISPAQQQQCPQSLHHTQHNQLNYTSGSHPHHLQSQQYSHEQTSHLAPNSKLQLTNNNNNNEGGVLLTMEECGVGGGGGPGMYPRSPQSENSQNSLDSSMSPAAAGEGRGASPVSYNNNNLMPTAPVTVVECGTGKVTGRTKHSHGSSSGKPSFSIESLLAHSGGWRRQQNNNADCGNKGVSIKDNRFLPYQIPQQPQQQHQQQIQQQGKWSTDNANITDKRQENLGGGNNKPSGGSSAGNGRRATKSKRVRTIFTPEQLETLEAEFERQQYMVGPERLYLASRLYLTEAQVKVWFQNRRIKWRKQHLEMEQQRLALYRSLTEQDIMASVGDEEEDDEQEEDSADCDYEMDEAESEAQRARVNTFPLNCTTVSSHPSSPTLNKLGSIPNKQGNPISSSSTKTDRLRITLQQSSSNEDYDASSSNTSSSSPTSFRGATLSSTTAS